jgi:hypothetical protein
MEIPKYKENKTSVEMYVVCGHMQAYREEEVKINIRYRLLKFVFSGIVSSSTLRVRN